MAAVVVPGVDQLLVMVVLVVVEEDLTLKLLKIEVVVVDPQ